MCGRYILRQLEESEKHWNVYGPPDWARVSYNVAPTQNVPVVISVDGRRVGTTMRWGLIPFFAKGAPGKYSMINARLETLEKSPAYRGPWKRGQRCILPAAGFYEWHLEADGEKQPYFIHLNDQEVFGFAGLWDRSIAPEGTAIESCTIITMAANEMMAEIHNTGKNPHRMPAILREEDQATWLEGTTESARAVLAPYRSEFMVAYPVSRRVNSPKNNDEKLIEPIDVRQAARIQGRS
jgi:putative SOS response-associated peptidase YedK